MITGLSGWLVDHGHRVTFLTFGPPSADDLPLDHRVQRVHLDIPLWSRRSLHRVDRVLRMLRLWRRTLDDLRPDVVVTHAIDADFYALLAARRSSIPVVVTVHADIRLHRFPIHLRLLRGLLYPSAAGVVVVARAALPWAQARWPRWEAVHLPNGVAIPTSDRPVAKPADRRWLGAMGRFHPVKRYPLLVDAFAALADRHPQWDLVLLGSGPDWDAVQEHIERRGLRHRVATPGWVDDPGNWITKFDLAAVTSEHEAFPLGLAETLASGVPVVAFDCGSGPGSLIRDGSTGVLVENGDVDGLVDALDEMMRDQELRTAYGRRAVEDMKQFRPDVVWPAWEDVLLSVTS